jgi:hypothetical protein
VGHDDDDEVVDVFVNSWFDELKKNHHLPQGQVLLMRMNLKIEAAEEISEFFQSFFCWLAVLSIVEGVDDSFLAWILL